MAKLTIHRALAELKLLEKRIAKKISESSFVGFQKGSTFQGEEPKEDFVKNSKASLDSILSLIKRQQNIKSKIIMSNSLTVVEIDGRKMTVAEAISMKSLIVNYSLLSKVILSNYSTAAKKVEKHNTRIESEALEIAKTLTGSGKDVDETTIQNVVNPYVKSNSLSILDPISSVETSEKYEKIYEGFISEVDAILSESNAVTTIDIE